MMKKTNLLPAMVVTTALLLSSSAVVIARTATPSATASTSASPTSVLGTASTSAMQNIKERVEKVMQTSDPEVKGMMDALKQQKFGIVGTLEKIVGSSLQIRTPNGTLRLTELDRDATILKGTKPISREDIELNAPTIVMGYRQADDLLLVRRLIVSDDSIFGVKRTTFYGKVVSLTTKLLTIATFQDGQQTSAPFKIGGKTAYLNSLNSTIKRSDIKVADPVIVVMPDEDASSSAARIYSLSAQAVPTPSTPIQP